MRPLSFGFPHFLQQMISSNLRWLRLKIQIKCPLAWSWWTSSSRRTRRRRTCSRRRWTRWSCPWRITPRSQSSWWLSPTQEPSQVSFLIMELVVAMPQSDLGGPGSVWNSDQGIMVIFLTLCTLLNGCFHHVKYPQHTSTNRSSKTSQSHLV